MREPYILRTILDLNELVGGNLMGKAAAFLEATTHPWRDVLRRGATYLP